MNRIWRALDRARAMNLAGEGAPAGVAGGDGITRRRLLAGLGGTIAASALPRWPAFAQAPLRVAIVGGGLAGLTALDILRARGIEAILYEARGAAGGRTRSVRGVFAPDFHFDEGGQLVNSDHADMLRLIDRFGLRLVDRHGYGSADEIQIGGDGGAVDDERLAAALRPIAARIAADSARLDADYAGVAPRIDAMSVKDYLDRHGLRAGDARAALEAGIRTEYGAEPEEASALELLFNLPVVDGRHVSRISTSDERYVIAGGSGQVAQALFAEHEAHIRLNKRLAAIDLAAGSPRLAFADGEQIEADRVILALPAPLIREVRITGPLPPLWRALIDEVRLGRNEKVIVGYDTMPWRHRLGFGGALWAAGDFSAVWDAASMPPSARPEPGALCYFLGGNQVDAAADVETRILADRFTGIARRVLPGLPEPNGRVRRTRWCQDPLTQGAYSNFRPGQLTRFGSLFAVEEEGEVRASAAGPLLFAGEWLSDAWPGYMNGAVQTGRLAAEAALAPARALAA
ncbi:MAG TPA: NAD(P)/FAD-dependent oxidoreductase [Allosphingosinicella sp.]|nr:NAD(P)/FAD-dependent oxidoreductase [Allosphingosinicella sp.]